MPIILFVVFLASIAVFAQDTPGAFKIDSIQYTYLPYKYQGNLSEDMTEQR